MAYRSLQPLIQKQLGDIRSAGLFKDEREIFGPQGSDIRVAQGEVLNFCANNYLGLANHPEVIQAAEEGLRPVWFWHGVGSVYMRNSGST